MNTQTFIIGLTALVLGGVGGYALNDQTPVHTMPDESAIHGADHGMQGEMSAMGQALEGKTGDEFDKAFLSEMIVHHEGAVEMAQAALQDSKHAELKTMANAIISAQTTEIEQMRNWQKAWYGY
jgi:uncharacterized protein (DUF305 family)